MRDNSKVWLVLKWVLYISSVLLVFLFSIDLLVTALGEIGKETAESIIEVAANPFVGLFVGLLITAMIQSSSTTTSMTVAMVASGSIELQSALPIIIGANIGTTLTSYIVAFNFIGKRPDFMRAFTTASIHNQFNLWAAVIFFPLQYYYNVLGGISEGISDLFDLDEGLDYEPILNGFFAIEDQWTQFILQLLGDPIILLLLAFALLFISIKVFTRMIYRFFVGPAKDHFQKSIFTNRAKSFGWGTLITSLLQSSSLTTSLIVPLVALDKVKIKSAYPFIIGANIGTTITALLAALFKSSEALSIAIAHLVFNLIGGIAFLAIPILFKLLIYTSASLAIACSRRRLLGIVYIAIIFFLLPFAFIYFSK